MAAGRALISSLVIATGIWADSTGTTKTMAMTQKDQEQRAADSVSAIDGRALQDEPAEKNTEGPAVKDGATHLVGLKLFLAMTGATLVMFLAMLDISIIGTVRHPARGEKKSGWFLLTTAFPGYPQDHKRTPQT